MSPFHFVELFPCRLSTSLVLRSRPSLSLVSSSHGLECMGYDDTASSRHEILPLRRIGRTPLHRHWRIDPLVSPTRVRGLLFHARYQQDLRLKYCFGYASTKRVGNDVFVGEGGQGTHTWCVVFVWTRLGALCASGLPKECKGQPVEHFPTSGVFIWRLDSHETPAG